MKVYEMYVSKTGHDGRGMPPGKCKDIAVRYIFGKGVKLAEDKCLNKQEILRDRWRLFGYAHSFVGHCWREQGIRKVKGIHDLFSIS